MITQKAQEHRQELVENLIDAMKQGTAPWQKPWTADAPFNAVTGRPYHGTNILNLAVKSSILGASEDPRWCTFDQAKEKGWSIKKGSKGTHVEFYKFDEKPKLDENGAPVLNADGQQEMQRSVVVKNYVVFHASQIDGIGPYVPKTHDPIEQHEKAERILKESGADIRHGGDAAYYQPKEDFVQLPDRNSFHSQADYYATALHELGHWTGHMNRLNRPLSYDMGSEKYAREELVAEITSMFVSAETGIPQTQEHFQNHAAYVNHWISHLEQNPNTLFEAVRDAHKATEEIMKHERVREQTQEQVQAEEQVQEQAQPEQAAPELSKEDIKALNLIPGEADPIIHMKPRTDDQQYKGKVLYVDANICIQQGGTKSMYVHDRKNLDNVPSVGDDVKIKYPKEDGLKASVTENESRKKVRSR